MITQNQMEEFVDLINKINYFKNSFADQLKNLSSSERDHYIDSKLFGIYSNKEINPEIHEALYKLLEILRAFDDETFLLQGSNFTIFESLKDRFCKAKSDFFKIFSIMCEHDQNSIPFIINKWQKIIEYDKINSIHRKINSIQNSITGISWTFIVVCLILLQNCAILAKIHNY